MAELSININVEVIGIDRLLDDIKKITSAKLANIFPNILIKSQNLVYDVLRDTEEYKSLLEDKGQLRQELGLENQREMLDDIVQSLQKAIRVELVPSGKDFLGGIDIGIYKSDFSDALTAKSAKYVSITKFKSIVVPWLEWLLFEGDKVVIIEDYGLFTHAKRGSRTGDHIMVKIKDGGKLKPWRMPPQFAGNISSNWLTKTAQATEPLLTNYIESLFKQF